MEVPPGTAPSAADAGAEHGNEAVEPPVSLRISNWSVVRAVAIVVVSLLVVELVVAASTVLWWLAIATAVAGLFLPAVSWLHRFVPSWLAILIVIVGVIAVVGLVGWRGVDETSTQFGTLRSNALHATTDISTSRQFGQIANEFGLVEKTEHLFDSLPVFMGGNGGSSGAAATVQSAASSGSSLFAISMLTLLMLIFGRRFAASALAQIDDVVVRRRVSDLVRDSYHESSRYVWLMFARAVVAGLTGALLAAVGGLPAPTALGLSFAALSLIPGMGIVLAALPVSIYAAAVTSPAAGVVVLATALVVQVLDVALVQRRIEVASVHVGPAPTLVAGLLGWQLYGLGGVLVGLAVAVFGAAVMRNLAASNREVIAAMRDLVTDDLDDTAAFVPVEPIDPIDPAGPADLGGGGGTVTP
jgi:predicted PurR-regulated permease PerM